MSIKEKWGQDTMKKITRCLEEENQIINLKKYEPISKFIYVL